MADFFMYEKCGLKTCLLYCIFLKHIRTVGPEKRHIVYILCTLCFTYCLYVFQKNTLHQHRYKITQAVPT